jgi:hypothetical protein
VHPKPSYQANLTPADGVRDIPDVALFASDFGSYAAWALCGDSVAYGVSGSFTDCELVNGKPTSATSLQGVGGTSAAAPAFAGILALISQSTGGRLGNPNPVLYSLAEKKPTDFNDTTVGNNSVDCEQGSPDCASNGFLTGYDTATGYDLASGLGSVNAANLLSGWPSVAFAPSTTALELGKSSSSLGTGGIVATHGTPIDFSIAVNPGASVTGAVSLITDSNVSVFPNTGAGFGFYPVNTDPTADGIVTGSTSFLPGGTYNLYAYYGGDTNYAASKSNPVPVTISPESSDTTLALAFYDASTSLPLGNVTTVPYGAVLFATATPQSKGTYDGVATGSVTFSSGKTALGTPVNLNSEGFASFNSLSQAPLPAGSYQMVASYGGDPSFKASSSAPSPFTITKAQISTSLSATSSGVNYSGSITLSVSILTDSIGDPPSGSVTFMSGQTVLGTAAIVPEINSQDYTDAGVATASIAGTQFPANGLNIITAVYAGDGNYAGSTSNGIGVTVSGVPVPSIGLSGPTSLTLANPGASASATITVTPFGGFTGTVNLTCAVTAPAGATSSPTCTPASASVTGTSAVTATLNISSTSTTTAGNYSISVTGVDAKSGKVTASTTIPLTVSPAAVPAFTLAATPATISGPGASATSTLTVTPSGGFTGAVALTCPASASGLTCDPATTSGGTATLNVHSATTTLPGSYSLTVNGVDAATGKIAASTTVPVTVNAAVIPSIAISSTPVAISSPGASAASTITVTPSGGFTGAVTLTCAVTSGPTGATSAPVCASTTATIAGSAPVSVALTLQTTSATTPGGYNITVTAAASGVSSATATVAVTVNTPSVQAGFALSGAPVTIATLGGSGDSTITVTPTGSFSGQINLKCALATAPMGASSDASCSFGTTPSVLITGPSPASATMIVNTTTQSAAALGSSRGGWLTASGGVSMAGLILLGMPARRRKKWSAMLLFLLAAAGMAAVGCGGHSTSTTTTGAGAYTFTVTGTDAATGTLVNTATVQVTVQ